MVQTHQPDQAVFRSVLPEDIDWKPFPAFPPSVRLAVLVGQPSEPGPYLIRVKVPAGVKLMPHKHPEDRIYTVMSAGDGSALDALIDVYRAFNAFDVKALAANWADGEAPSIDNPIGGIRRGWPAVKEGYAKLLSGPATVRRWPPRRRRLQWCSTAP